MCWFTFHFSLHYRKKWQLFRRPVRWVTYASGCRKLLIAPAWDLMSLGHDELGDGDGDGGDGGDQPTSLERGKHVMNIHTYIYKFEYYMIHGLNFFITAFFFFTFFCLFLWINILAQAHPLKITGGSFQAKNMSNQHPNISHHRCIAWDATSYSPGVSASGGWTGF